MENMIDNLPPHYVTILRLWEAGLSGGKIGEEIGKTRSAVLSIVRKMREMGVVTRRYEVDMAKSVMRDAVTGDITVRLTKKKLAKKGDGSYRSDGFFRREDKRKAGRDIVDANVRGDEIYIEELTRFKCRYINGSVDGADTLYCGHTVTRGVYCTEHAALCYTDALERTGARHANYAPAKPTTAR